MFENAIKMRGRESETDSRNCRCVQVMLDVWREMVILDVGLHFTFLSRD